MFVKNSAFRGTLIRWEVGLLAGFAVLFILSLLRTAAIERAIVAEENVEKGLNSAYQTEVEIESLLTQIAAVESGHRGYLLTNNPVFLDAYYANQDGHDPAIDSIRGGFQRLNLGTQEVQLFDALIKKKYQHLKRSLDLFQKGQRDRAADLAITGEGKDLMDEIRASSSVLSSALRRHRSELAIEANSADLMTSRINQTTGLMGTPIIVLLLFLAWRAVRAYYDGIELRAKLASELEEAVITRTNELKTAKDELEAFSYSVSHDLRGPLRAVVSYAAMLEEDYGEKLDPDAIEYIDRIKASGRRMSELIDTLLALSRLSRADISVEEVDASAVASEILADLRAGAPEGAHTVSIEPGIMVKADRKMLTTLLDNLLRNAWKFSGRNPNPEIQIFFDEHQNAIAIQDNGVGFNQEYANKLFQPFQRLHSEREFEGTGIGLAIVDRIVKRHAGRVWATSEVGQGATFYIQLSPDAKSIWQADSGLKTGVR